MMARREFVQASMVALAAAAASNPTIAFGATPIHRIDGQGEPVLLIAGYSCDLTVWDVATPLIVQNGFRVIRFNNLGVGRGVRFSPNDISISSMARHAAELIRALGLSSVHVVGHSMGGQIAQELALMIPQRVRSLTLLSTWVKPGERLTGLLTELSKLADKISPEEWQRAFLPWILTDTAYSAEGLIDQVVKANVANPDRLSPTLLQAQAAAIAASDTTGRLNDLKIPSLVSVGEQDILVPAVYSRAVNKAIAGSTFELLPGGHGIIGEAAPELTRHLAAFLRAHPIK
jgi:pimeloyl-ACP methyl ester carboxylesterase